MPELRWILIVFGSALLIGIYVWGRRGAKNTAAADDSMLRIRPAEDFEPRENIEPSVDVPQETPSHALEHADPAAQSLDDEPIAPARAAHIDESREPTIEVMRAREVRAARIEPTFGDDAQTAELPVNDAAEREPDVSTASAAASEAPTLGMSNTPPPRRIERRKIIALRLATAPQRIAGAQLQSALDGASLQHGKYDVFHRLDAQGAAIFSVASMVEPGTFDLDKMASESYPGITLFTQLPGPVAGMLAFNELVACGRRLQAALGGTLQDERGVPLTVHRIERIRQEIREFEHRPAGESSQRASPTYSS